MYMYPIPTGVHLHIFYGTVKKCAQGFKILAISIGFIATNFYARMPSSFNFGSWRPGSMKQLDNIE